MASINDLYNRIYGGMGAYDPRTDSYEQECLHHEMKAMARQQALMREAPPVPPPKPVPNPEPNPALLLLGEDA